LETAVVNVLILAHLIPILAAISVDSLVSKAGSVLLVAIGIGLVIFFHELGHFAVAKWCDVFVERFSIGFGPIIWSRKYGETEYALSAIPFGGYVKMLGQDDLDPSQMTSEELAKDPRSYMAKPVGQRMAIISAGVTMNIITGVMFYAIAFGHGIEALPARVGSLVPGFPAWDQGGLQPGDRITSIDGRPTKTFEDINRAIALTTGPIEIKGTHVDGKTFDISLTPNLSDGRRMIGVSPALSLEVFKTRGAGEPAADPGSPAADATPAFEPDDRIVGLDGHEVTDFSQAEQLLIEDRAKPAVFKVVRDGDTAHPIDIKVPAQRYRQLGLTMDIGKVTAMVKDSPAEKNGIQEGDKIIRLNNRSVGEEIDPLRLPDELASLAGQEVTIVVQRESKQADPKLIDIRLVPLNKPAWLEPMLRQDVPLSIPAIGVACNVIPTVVAVQPGSSADKAGIKKGDRIKKAELVLKPDIQKDFFGDKAITLDLTAEKENKLGSWPFVVYMTQLATDRNVRLTFVEKDREAVELTPFVEPKSNWFVAGTRGLRLSQEFMILKSNGIADAAVMGLTHTKNSIIDLYLTLRNLFTRNLSYENLHGPLGIISVAYGVAQQGIPEMCLFLGILSANLAVLNFLPIPVLDGGHMVFLIWEGVTRKRPSERVQIAATYFGMAFVLCLAILVFYLDIFKHHVLG
jgi:regulator of sigma E protease